jgi:glutathione S-transferase
MNITLYGLTAYDRSGKARWLLNELGIEHADYWLDRETREHEGEAFLKINPLGRSPAMQIEGKTIFESGAICAYLADRFIEGKMAPALSSPERLEYQQWMYFAAATVDSLVGRIMIIEDIPPGEVFQAKEAAFTSELTDACELLNDKLSKNDYLLASGFSAADICVSYHLYVLNLWPEVKVIVDRLPHLIAYLERVQKRPAAEKSKVFSFPT